MRSLGPYDVGGAVNRTAAHVNLTAADFGLDPVTGEPIEEDSVDTGGSVNKGPVNRAPSDFGFDDLMGGSDEDDRVDAGGSVNRAPVNRTPSDFGFDHITLGLGMGAALATSAAYRRYVAPRIAPGGHGPVHPEVPGVPLATRPAATRPVGAGSMLGAFQAAAAHDPYGLGKPL